VQSTEDEMAGGRDPLNNRKSLAKDNMSKRRNPTAREKSESFEARGECLSESRLKKD
jgi:hypothetical protein